MGTTQVCRRSVRFVGLAASSVSLSFLLAACGSGGQGPTGSGGSTPNSGGANGSGGVSAGSGGNSSATGGAGSGGMMSSSGGRAANSGGAPGTGGRENSGGATNTGGAGGGATASGGRAGGASGTGGANVGGTTGGTFTITSPGWTTMAGCSADMKTPCGNLPAEITRSGAGTSPALNWTGAPAGTKSFAVVVQDLSGNSTHWAIWNIPATATGLPANVDRNSAMPATPAGSQQCSKSPDTATKFGYYGPGAPCNVYEFKVYALNVSPFAPTAAACANTTDAAAIRTQLNGLNASMLLGTAALLGKTNTGCN